MGENNDASASTHFLTYMFQVPKHELFQIKVQDLEELLQPLENVEDQEAEEDLPHMIQSAQEEQPLQEQHENWVRDHTSMQLHRLFKMIVYSIHIEVNKTPLHMMLGHAIYAIYRSKSLLIAFSMIGSYTSYHTNISDRSLLSNYVVKCSAD